MRKTMEGLEKMDSAEATREDEISRLQEREKEIREALQKEYQDNVAKEAERAQQQDSQVVDEVHQEGEEEEKDDNEQQTETGQGPADVPPDPGREEAEREQRAHASGTGKVRAEEDQSRR